MSANIYSKNWLDQVFEKRNKTYGAYYLRLHADDYTLAGLAFSLAVVFAAAAVPAISNLFAGTNQLKPLNNLDHILTFTEVQLPDQPPVIEQVKPTTAVAAKPKMNHEMVNPLIADDEDVIDDRTRDELNTDPNKTNGNSNSTLPSDSATVLTGGSGVSLVPSIDTMIYRGGVEIMPEFPGGERAMMQFLLGNLKYPRHLINENISGMVYLSFIINKNGEVTKVETLRGIKASRDFENEAMRVVAMMPKWKPGRQNGQNVNVYFTLPVSFVVR